MCTKISRDGLDLMKKMLIYDPVVRINTEDALNHPFFDNIDKSKFAERDYWSEWMKDIATKIVNWLIDKVFYFYDDSVYTFRVLNL